MTDLYFICITFCYLTGDSIFSFPAAKTTQQYSNSFFQKQPNKQSIIKANRYYYEKIVQSYKRMYIEKEKKEK